MRPTFLLLLLFALTLPGRVLGNDAVLSCEPNFARLETPTADLYISVLAGLTPKLTVPQEAALQALFRSEDLPGPEANLATLLSAVGRAASAKNLNEFKYLTLVYSQPTKYKEYSPEIIRSAFAKVEKSLSPYSAGHELGGNRKSFGSMDEILALQKIMHDPDGAAEAANFWVKSPAHAVYLYQNLGEFGKSATAVLGYLIDRNEFFKRVGRVRGPPNTVVTLAFEKETRKKEISLLYRDARMTDDDWMKLDEDERYQRLEALIVKTKVATAPDVVAPTSLLPESAGGLMREPLPSGEANLFEFAHKGYEIDPARITKGMNEVSGLFKENDFHVHLVFDLPKKYSQMPEFTSWLKQSNDYLYLKGMEEHGAHASKYIGIPEPALKRFSLANARKKIRLMLNPGSETSLTKGLPTTVSEIDRQNFKFMGAGLRRNIYGESNNPAFTKVGVELRDATRDMGTWEKLVNKFHASVSAKIWENPSLAKAPIEVVLTPKPLPAELALLTQNGFSKEFIEIVTKAEPTFTIPLKPFEKGSYRDYHNNGFRTAHPGSAERIAAAREKYLSELKLVQKELEDYKAKGEAVDPDNIQLALRMTMSEWAREARVSTLFEGI